MIVTVSELGQTSLYPEIINDITRNTQAAAEAQILEAEDMCKAYLCKYDLVALFGDSTASPAVSPTVTSPFIKGIIRTIATYHLVRQAAPNIDIEIWRDEYDLAIKQLEGIRDGNLNLPGVPYASEADPVPDTASESMAFDSNPKRINHF